MPIKQKKNPHKRIIRLSYFTGLSVGQLKMNTFKKMIRTEMRMFKQLSNNLLEDRMEMKIYDINQGAIEDKLIKNQLRWFVIYKKPIYSTRRIKKT